MKSISFKALPISQPVGNFFVAVINSDDLFSISYSDVRRMEKREIETYLGIQRELRPDRVKEISAYTKTKDASFPTSVILAVKGQCANWSEELGVLTLSEYSGDSETEAEAIPFQKIAKILDGQHRVAGLEGYSGAPFQINVSIFIDADIAEQATIFATVNLAQTKVNKSLVYDLFELSRARSPQKTCHNIAVALNDIGGSPLHHRIKRLGIATEGRFTETITQATFVESLLRFITSNANFERDLLLRGKKIEKPNEAELKRFPFRGLFVEEQDVKILQIVSNYFSAVKERWPTAWEDSERGKILSRTNGFRALIRFLKLVYVEIAEPGDLVDKDQFLTILNRVQLTDSDFNISEFPPGTSGESALFKRLKGDTLIY